MALGLMFGLGAVTWAFSGMLSMEPFPASAGNSTARQGGNSDARISNALHQPVRLTPYAAKTPREALAGLEPLGVKELELTTFAGESVYLATLDRGGTRVVPLAGNPQREFDQRRIIDVLTQAAQPNALDIRVMDRYDMYYLDRRHRRPLPVILARVDDADRSRYYVDPKTARVVAKYSSRDWLSRWLYHGLHSLDFPWLYDYRPAWDIVVITFMIGGTTLSLTSVILAWRAVGRRLMRSAAADTTLG
jgi:hypothetical protein